MKLALKITPQRNTQYANMTKTLAAPELLTSPLGSSITHIEPATLAGQAYLLVDIDEGNPHYHPECVSQSLVTLSEVSQSPVILSASEGSGMLTILSRLGATSEAYEYFEHIGDVQGPLLRPLEPQFTPFVPLQMAEIRRYKGKTNEIFTRVLLNTAVFAGAYSQEFSGRLRKLDPLAGGGTTLFLALAAGYDAFGVEQSRQDVDTTAVFIRQYFNSERKKKCCASAREWIKYSQPSTKLLAIGSRKNGDIEQYACENFVGLPLVTANLRHLKWHKGCELWF
jgi:hypothetical protein